MLFYDADTDLFSLGDRTDLDLVETIELLLDCRLADSVTDAFHQAYEVRRCARMTRFYRVTTW